MQSLLELAKNYHKAVIEEGKLTAEQVLYHLPRSLNFIFDRFSRQALVANVGKLDAKKHLEADVENLMGANIVHSLGTMLNTVVF